jgi:hypothetical protein
MPEKRRKLEAFKMKSVGTALLVVILSGHTACGQNSTGQNSNNAAQTFPTKLGTFETKKGALVVRESRPLPPIAGNPSCTIHIEAITLYEVGRETEQVLIDLHVSAICQFDTRQF